MIRFKDIVGQDRAIGSLGRALLADRLHHGLIFAGPQGVGKRTTAEALAGVFLCDRPAGLEACGTCAACRVMGAGNHPDYHVITKELIRVYDRTGTSKGIDLSIHVIRPELLDRAALKPAMGRGKVFVIEEADLMNLPAQNAMLKTLEEPAGRTLIILLTDQPGALLPTIRSRCQLVAFGALDNAMVMAELKKRGIEEGIARDAVEFGEGSLGLALRWIDDGVIEFARALREFVLDLISGRWTFEPDLPAWFKQAGEAYAARQLQRDELASKDQKNREGLGVYLKLAADVLRRQLPGLALEEGPMEEACDAIEALHQSQVYLDGNVNVALIFQDLAVTLAAVLCPALTSPSSSPRPS